jgi:uncharacterized protein involved in exopolysaccharide biosynthesis
VAVILFIPLAFLAWTALTPTYEAQTRLLVILDENDLAPGAAGSGGAFTLDQVMESESQILDSDAVRRRAIEARTGELKLGTAAALCAKVSPFRARRTPACLSPRSRLRMPMSPRIP